MDNWRININMYFAKLNLPQIPEEFIESCLANISLINTDPSLAVINSYRSPPNRATTLPTNVIQWLLKNVFEPNFFPLDEELTKPLLNVTKYSEYIQNPKWHGSQGKHIDIGRNWALNYYFDLGGENTKLQWWAPDRTAVIAETTVKPLTWYLLKVDILHAVRNIEKNKMRIFISAGCNGQSELYFKNVIDVDSVIN